AAPPRRGGADSVRTRRAVRAGRGTDPARRRPERAVGLGAVTAGGAHGVVTRRAAQRGRLSAPGARDGPPRGGPLLATRRSRAGGDARGSPGGGRASRGGGSAGS